MHAYESTENVAYANATKVLQRMKTKELNYVKNTCLKIVGTIFFIAPPVDCFFVHF